MGDLLLLLLLLRVLLRLEDDDPEFEDELEDFRLRRLFFFFERPDFGVSDDSLELELESRAGEAPLVGSSEISF